MPHDAPWWAAHGYLAGRPLDGDLWLTLHPQLFTLRLAICTVDAVHQFWCYPNPADAIYAYAHWDGVGDPPDGWVKHHPTGRRRPAPPPTTVAIAPGLDP